MSIDQQLNDAIRQLQALNFGEEANDGLASPLRDYHIAVALGLEVALLAQKVAAVKLNEMVENL